MYVVRQRLVKMAELMARVTKLMVRMAGVHGERMTELMARKTELMVRMTGVHVRGWQNEQRT
jgi:hypothetical protein